MIIPKHRAVIVRVGSHKAIKVVEALTPGIVNKIMHTPITTLKTAARDPEAICTASIEMDPPSTPSTGNVTSSPCCLVAIT